MERHRPRTTFHRRRFLRGSGLLLATGLAGCAGAESGGEGGSPSGRRTGPVAGTDGTTEGTPIEPGQGKSDASDADVGETTTAPGDLDLQEANVLDVEVEAADGAYRFSVTLYHDDGGEDGYANWWQVETLEGEQLGRRELVHAHGTAPFTRSETVEIPEGVSCVVVRGHDRTHGYGGQAMLVDVGTGATKAVRQGPEPRSFGPADCP